MADEDRPKTYAELAEANAALSVENAGLKRALEIAAEAAKAEQIEAEGRVTKKPKPRVLDKNSASAFERPYDGR